MAPSAKVKKAFKAMKDIGIPEAKTKPVLKKLLQVFEKNWDAIEAENYRVLADAIFDDEEAEAAEKEKKKNSENAQQGQACAAITWQDGPMPDDNVPDELERPLKRLRLKQQSQPSPTPGLLIPKPEPGGAEASSSPHGQPMTGSQTVSPQPLVRNKGKQPVSTAITRASTGRVSQALVLKEPKEKRPQINALLKPKDEPFSDDMVSIEPLAVVLPESLNKEAPAKPSNKVGSQDGPISETLDEVDKGMELIASNEQEQLQEDNVSNRSLTLDIAASTLGEVKISLTCNLGSEGNGIHLPDLEAIMKKMDDNCLRTYKITNPEFSITKVMKQLCDCVVELGRNANEALEVNSSLNGEFSEVMSVTTDMTLAENSTPPLASLSPEIHMQNDQNTNEDDSAEKDASVIDMNLKSIVAVPPCDAPEVHISLNGEFSEVMAVTMDMTLADNYTPPLASISPEIHMQNDQNAIEDNSAKRDASVIDMNLKSIVTVPPCDAPEVHSSLIGKLSEAMAVTMDTTLAGNSTPPLDSISPEMRMQNDQNAIEDNSAERDASVIDMNLKSIVAVHPYDAPEVNRSLDGEFSEVMAVITDMILADTFTPPLISISPEIHMQNDQNATEDNSAEKDASIVDMNLQSIVVVHPYDTGDITRGKETIRVSLEKSNCEFLPSFHYISRNVILDNADVKFSLAQIGDKDCCLSCQGDCLSSSSSCNCSQRNGGESPYTPDSLVREEFLDECVSMVRSPQKDNLMYCNECPLERLKNEDMLDPCKGHLKRKFIKECYTKCGCSQYCGNRVVQQGIRCNLQVFWTPEGKGWGLRTLDNLPKGAFVCEFVGEILTSMEFCKRNRSRSNEKHSFSLLLDTDWGMGALKEEKLLCLDATFYGNAARFINHRCTDASLIEIPVEVETPSHHYYHVALFTTRNVNAFEELTWDYGVDFDDSDLHNKAFRCLCSSEFCRNMKRSTSLVYMKRSTRSRSALTLQ